MLVGQAVRDAQLLRQVSALHRAGGQLGLRRGPVAVGGTRREQGGYHTPPHTHNTLSQCFRSIFMESGSGQKSEYRSGSELFPKIILFAKPLKKLVAWNKR